MSSMTNTVMQMLMGGSLPGEISPANLNDRLDELVRNDSRVAPIVQHLRERLAARNTAIEAQPQEATVGGEEEHAIVEMPKDPGRNQELKFLAKRMFAELQALRTRNGMLANVLGACCQCWGEDPNCDYCCGDGRIGSYLINPKVFDTIVGPALEQLRQRPPLVKRKKITDS